MARQREAGSMAPWSSVAMGRSIVKQHEIVQASDRVKLAAGARTCSAEATIGLSSTSSSATEVSSSRLDSLKILKSLCVPAGRKSSYLMRRISLGTRSPARARTWRKSCDGFFFPSSSCVHSLKCCRLAESVSRARIASLRHAYLPVLGGVCMTSSISWSDSSMESQVWLRLPKWQKWLMASTAAGGLHVGGRRSGMDQLVRGRSAAVAALKMSCPEESGSFHSP